MQKEEKIPSTLDDFTNLYQVQKTLRFELKPIGKTLETLLKNEVFKKDEEIEKSYQEIKPIFDNLHRKFVTDALDAKNIDVAALIEFAKKYSEYRADPKKNRKILEDAEKKLWKLLAKNFDVVGDEWKDRYNGRTYLKSDSKSATIKLKKSGHEVLMDEDVLGILAIAYPEHKELFQKFAGFFTYFSGFNLTRENFYKNDGTATAVVTRVVDNFEKFLENKDIFKRHLKLRSELSLTDEECARVSTIESYAKCLLQADIEKYNLILGELNRRMKMLRDEQGKDVKKSDYPLLKTIHDQILGDRKKETPFIVIESNEEARKELNDLLNLAGERFTVLRKLIERLRSGELSSDIEGIYLTNKAINTISRRWFNDGMAFEQRLPQGKKRKGDDAIKVAYFVALADIRSALENIDGDVFKDSYREVIATTDDRLMQFILILAHEFDVLFEGRGTENGWTASVERMKRVMGTENNLRSKKCKPVVKECLDAGLRILQLAKYFSLDADRKKAAEKPKQISVEFYNAYDAYTKDFSYAKKYNAFRDYFSKKIGDDANKVKLNFENGMLLEGWDRNKEIDYQGFIFKDEQHLFLGITGPEGARLFQKEKDYVNDSSAFKKMYYKQLEKVFRQLPRIAFSKKGVSRYAVDKELLAVKKEFDHFQESKKGSNKDTVLPFDTGKLKKLIDLYKRVLVSDYSTEFDIKDLCDLEYSKLNDFYTAVEEKTYSLKWINISKAFIDEAVNNGTLYLFEIRNKDNNLKDGKVKTGTKNLHSMYWDALFSETNLKKPRLKLSGGAELFLRRGKPEELKKRTDASGKEVTEHRRYAEDKLFFHVPIVMNRGGDGARQGAHNLNVRTFLAHNRGVCVIGIDRGEKHLLYYSVINQKGEIIDQGSLNTIKKEGSEDGGVVDYYQKLVDCEKRRVTNQQSWEPARKIKDLKSGYVSQAVHVVCELIYKYKAIVVLEDLNMRFKQVRGGVARSVYQQFEHALINKLGYLVFKDRKADEVGGVFHGYQLTAPFESFEKLGKQSGFLFYTQADYTSITDPLTGFRKNVYVSNAASIEALKKVFSEKIELSWDEKRSSYFFTYDQKDFGLNGKRDVPSKVWKVYANVPRMKRFRDDGGHWHANLVNPNEMLEELFNVWDIKNSHADIMEHINIADEEKRLQGKRTFDGKEREFWKSLIYIFNLILLLRNSSSQQYSKNEKGEIAVTGEEIDFIASPVEPFFRTAFVKDGKKYPAQLGGVADRITGSEKDRIMAEFNGDANGAYNIARKGLMILNAIKRNFEKPELFISRNDWDTFVQKIID